jgi:hypothetical protein
MSREQEGILRAFTKSLGCENLGLSPPQVEEKERFWGVVLVFLMKILSSPQIYVMLYFEE